MSTETLNYSFIEDKSSNRIEVAFGIKDRMVVIEFTNEALKNSLLKRDDNFLLALFQSQPSEDRTQLYPLSEIYRKNIRCII